MKLPYLLNSNCGESTNIESAVLMFGFIAALLHSIDTNRTALRDRPIFDRLGFERATQVTRLALNVLRTIYGAVLLTHLAARPFSHRVRKCSQVLRASSQRNRYLKITAIIPVIAHI
ncbi:hypothetical protein FOPG_20153 [Fusarium oxysporum f. sp. conglutinans race 2 54008]|uniref:Uncharacterized protein n=1 Tax=Fusarium oxysporum f. sp. conglutinans race 2 54008 TaxID=1089457 RepID=X0GJT6_FUSOX|nr:hypothetical protein FOPG_20153 [Fusarium oxysporum f. sp. conglutinans race 2 54008]